MFSGLNCRALSTRSNSTAARWQKKISIAPGPIFSATQKYKNCIRLSCGLPWSERLEQAIHTLGDLANKAP